jgi:hypothetical protein
VPTTATLPDGPIVDLNLMTRRDAAHGAPVSGLPFEIPWIEFNPGAPAWITGGPFGPEGGLLATVALIAGTVAVARWKDFPEGR